MSNWGKAITLGIAIALGAVALNLVQDADAGPREATNSTPEQSASIWSGEHDISSIGSNNANDQRSNVMNPNNDSFQAAADNRSNQMNPNNSAYWSSRGR